MELNLQQLRAELQKDPFLAQVIRACATGRQFELTTVALCLQRLGLHPDDEPFKRVVHAFSRLEKAGLGALLHQKQRARARFRWAIPVSLLETVLRNPDATLSSQDLLPWAVKWGLQIPTPLLDIPERPGWTRHQLTLRPSQTAEVFIPDDFTDTEAKWLADFILRLGEQGK